MSKNCVCFRQAYVSYLLVQAFSMFASSWIKFWHTFFTVQAISNPSGGASVFVCGRIAHRIPWMLSWINYRKLSKLYPGYKYLSTVLEIATLCLFSTGRIYFRRWRDTERICLNQGNWIIIHLNIRYKARKRCGARINLWSKVSTSVILEKIHL